MANYPEITSSRKGMASLYLDDMRNYSLLTKNEEITLAEQLRESRETLFNKVIRIGHSSLTFLDEIKKHSCRIDSKKYRNLNKMEISKYLNIKTDKVSNQYQSLQKNISQILVPCVPRSKRKKLEKEVEKAQERIYNSLREFNPEDFPPDSSVLDLLEFSKKFSHVPNHNGKSKLERELAMNLGALPQPFLLDIPSLEADYRSMIEAKQKMAEGNIRLVIPIAKSYIRNSVNLSFDDIIEEGNLGLMRAIEKYDHRTGNKFSTYATWWIKQSIRRTIEESNLIKIPERTANTLKILRDIDRVSKIPLSPEEIEDQHNIPISQQINARKAGKRVCSLDLNNGEGNSYFYEILYCPNINTDVNIHKAELDKKVNKVLDTLEAREKEVLKLRFGFYDGKEYTLEEIGRMFKVTRERIRQVEINCLDKLKMPVRIKHLENLL